MRFKHQGVTLIREAVPRGVAEDWAYRAVDWADMGHRIERKGDGQHRAGDEGGDYRHYVMDAYQVQALLPDLWQFYQNELIDIAERVVRRKVILSPYAQSSVNVKVYAPNDEQGWHRDTNALTALLYLTDCDEKTGTLVEPLDGTEPFALLADAGDLLIMQGRKVRHKVQPVPGDYPTRVTCPLNLYYPGDTWRPEGIDEIVYS